MSHTNGYASPSVIDRLREMMPVSPPPAPAVPSAPPPLPEPFVPFPLELLPRPLARLASEGAAALVCDPSYLALPALAVVAGAIGNSRTLRLKRTWCEPAILWTAVIGDSGTLKTPAYKMAMAPLYGWQRQEKQRHEVALKLWRQQEEPDETSKPALRRAFCSDVTIEKLAEMLEENPRGVLVARDELRGWLGSFARYKSQQGSSDLPNWLELYQAGAITYDRKTGEHRSVVVDHASVSITGNIQPATLARTLTAEHFGSGLVARLLMAWPLRRPKRWTDADIDLETENGWRRLIEGLLTLAMRSTLDEGFEPFRIDLHPDAKVLWVRYYDEWADVQASAEGELAACYSKIEGAAARLALIHHVVTMVDLEHDDRCPLWPASMEAGIGMARWFAAESSRIYALLSETEEQTATRKLVEWIRSRGGRATARELQRSNGKKYPTVNAAEAMLSRLAQFGFGTWEEGNAPVTGGHRIRQFVLSDVRQSDTRPSETTERSDTRLDHSP